MKNYLLAWILIITVVFMACDKGSDGNTPPPPPPPPPTVGYTVTTLPGSFNSPVHVTVDASGNVYVTDNTNRIAKISSTGTVDYAFAGTGLQAMVDGIGSIAAFWSPYGMAMSEQGTFYVADIGNNAIRKVTQDRYVSTVAGLGNAGEGYVDGLTSIAKFNKPYDVALDAPGNIYVADRNNKKIRMINTSAVVSTVAPTVTFSDPISIASDASGNLFIGDYLSIKKISTTGQVTTLGNQATTYAATGIAVASNGNLYFVNRVVNSIVMMTPSGVETTIAGGTAGYADGEGTAAKFNAPMGLALDASGNIYVADFGNNKIRKITKK